MESGRAEDLLAELIADPRRFVEEGRPYALLQAYLQGLAIESLRSLIRSDDVWVQRAAGFVASELGHRVGGLIDDVVLLFGSSDPHVQNYAMEILAVCDTGRRLVHVLNVLKSDHPGLRQQAMDLVARASEQQLKEALNAAIAHNLPAHAQGLRMLVGDDKNRLDGVIAELADSDPLVRRYGAIAVKRFGLSDSRLVREVLSRNDSELLAFLPHLNVEPD